jgi:hypothetical protein
VEMKKLLELEIDDAFQVKQKVWPSSMSTISAKHHTKLFQAPLYICKICIYLFNVQCYAYSALVVWKYLNNVRVFQ